MHSNPEIQTNTQVALSNETLKLIERSIEGKRKIGSHALVNVIYPNSNEIGEKEEINTEVVGSNSRSMIEFTNDAKRITTTCSPDDMPILAVLEKDGIPNIYMQNYNNPMENKNKLVGELYDFTTEGGYKIQRVVILTPKGKTEASKNTNDLITDYLTDIVRSTKSGKDADVQICTYDEDYLSKKDGIKLNAEFTQRGKAIVRVNSKKINSTPQPS